MKTFVVCVVVGVLALGASACTTAEIHTASLDTAPYAQFHTFSFAALEEGSTPPGRALTGYRSSPRSAHVIELMKPAVAEVLERKGYTPAPQGESDLVIVCSAGRRDAEAHLRLPWRVTAITGEQYEDRDFIEGGLVIDVFDKTGGQIWHGAARTEINPEKPNDARVHDVVESVMEAFPSRPK